MSLDLRSCIPDEEIIPYECDGLSAYRTRPLLVVLPKQMEQVTAILAVCHRLRVPVVTRGAGTGLSGGALPLEKGVLLVMARFKEILDIKPRWSPRARAAWSA
ncbi:glycolate oxidase subunit [Escherichia coli]|uniref:Glycolate oxidase subunit n=1 Tax=Escherichia coli TaxID=562 RepID=A0A2X1JZQ7_ECOLX|nr:glycolate oxidase subunit [Escherichia coli]